MPRFQIAWLMVAIALVAFDLGAIRGLLGVRDTFENVVAVGVLPMANLLAFGAILGATRRRFTPFLTGFEIFGAVAMLACFVWAWLSPDSLTLYLLVPVVPVVDSLRATWGEPARSVIYAIASVLLTLPQVLFALAGGGIASLAATFVKRRRRKRSERV